MGLLTLLSAPVDNNDSYSISRIQLVYGLTLPVAALLGFMLAEPFGSNLMVVLIVVGALLLPLLMRWYHPLLVASWNATLIMSILPGQPPWWMLLTAAGFFIIVINQCVGARTPLMVGGGVPVALLLIAVVVVVTALLTGGAGIRTLGGASFGGKRYVYVASAIAGYFVLVSRAIPPHRAWMYVSLFLLAGATSGLSGLANSGFDFLHYVVPASMTWYDNGLGGGIGRISSVGALSAGLGSVVLARYGVRGVLDMARWWRLLFLIGVIGLGLFSGFRSAFLAQVCTFGLLFVIQGLHRSRHLLLVVLLLILGGVGLALFSARLPLSVQRSLSFLPIEIDPVVMADARDSFDWRTEMWRAAWPEARAHFWLGEGFAISPDELYMASVNSFTGNGLRSEVSATARDYHSGPLSVLIPFGIWGALAFGWFIFVSLRLLYRHAMEGRPELRTINQFLLASFATGNIFFLLVFGDFSYDLVHMVGVVGLSVSLNRDVPNPVEESSEEIEGQLEEA